MAERTPTGAQFWHEVLPDFANLPAEQPDASGPAQLAPRPKERARAWAGRQLTVAAEAVGEAVGHLAVCTGCRATGHCGLGKENFGGAGPTGAR